jgi:hypothetical protein
MDEADVQRAIDRLDISELLALWLLALDTFDWNTLRDRAFAADLEWDWRAEDGKSVMSQHTQGSDEAIAWFAAVIPPTTRARHLVSNTMFEFPEGSVRTTSYLSIVNSEDLRITANGLMTAEHVRTPAGWRIGKLRVVEQVPRGALSSGESSEGAPDEGVRGR